MRRRPFCFACRSANARVLSVFPLRGCREREDPRLTRCRRPTRLKQVPPHSGHCGRRLYPRRQRLQVAIQHLNCLGGPKLGRGLPQPGCLPIEMLFRGQVVCVRQGGKQHSQVEHRRRALCVRRRPTSLHRQYQPVCLKAPQQDTAVLFRESPALRNVPLQFRRQELSQFLLLPPLQSKVVSLDGHRGFGVPVLFQTNTRAHGPVIEAPLSSFKPLLK